MIRAEIKYGEEHYRAISKSKGNAIIAKVVFFTLLLAAALIYTFVKTIPLMTAGLWIIVVYVMIFIIASGSWLVRAAVALSTLKSTFLRENAGRTEYLSFDGDEVVLKFDRGFEESEKHLKYPAVKSALRNGDWFEITLKEDKLMFFSRELTEGTADELSALLAEKLGERFKTEGAPS